MNETTTNGTTGDVTFADAAAASAEAQIPELKTEKVTRSIEVKLTDAEIADVGRDLATAIRNVAAAEATKKARAAEDKEAIEEVEAERDRLVRVIESGVTLRNVDCFETKDFRLGKVTVTEAETGRIVSERPMEGWERQMEFNGVDQELDVDAELAPTSDGPRYEPEDDEDPNAITDPIATLGADAEVKPLRRMARKKAKEAES